MAERPVGARPALSDRDLDRALDLLSGGQTGGAARPASASSIRCATESVSSLAAPAARRLRPATSATTLAAAAAGEPGGSDARRERPSAAIASRFGRARARRGSGFASIGRPVRDHGKITATSPRPPRSKEIGSRPGWNRPPLPSVRASEASIIVSAKPRIATAEPGGTSAEKGCCSTGKSALAAWPVASRTSS